VAGELETPDPSVPAAGEAIHLPEGSFLPFAMALAIMVTLVGLLIGWIISALGLIVVLVVLFRWIGSTRRDMAELPLEH
jgi:hypothetical protein